VTDFAADVLLMCIVVDNGNHSGSPGTARLRIFIFICTINNIRTTTSKAATSWALFIDGENPVGIAEARFVVEVGVVFVSVSNSIGTQQLLATLRG